MMPNSAKIEERGVHAASLSAVKAHDSFLKLSTHNWAKTKPKRRPSHFSKPNGCKYFLNRYPSLDARATMRPMKGICFRGTSSTADTGRAEGNQQLTAGSCLTTSQHFSSRLNPAQSDQIKPQK
jgi:hypothetical protein